MGQLIVCCVSSEHDPTADHNQQSHVPRVPLRASENSLSERADTKIKPYHFDLRGCQKGKMLSL